LRGNTCEEVVSLRGFDIGCARTQGGRWGNEVIKIAKCIPAKYLWKAGGLYITSRENIDICMVRKISFAFSSLFY